MINNHEITACENNRRLLVVIRDYFGAEIARDTFATKPEAYAFIDAHNARRTQRITVDPTTGGVLQTRLAGSRR